MPAFTRRCPRFPEGNVYKSQLEREFNTVAKLRDHAEIAKFADWIRTKPNGFRAAMRSSKAIRFSR